MSDVDILVSGGIVVTVDANRRIIKDGAVAIDGSRIVGVGKKDILEKKFKADRVIDAGRKIVMPGLISGHTHPVQHLARGLGDDVDLTDWVHHRIMHYEAALTADDAYTSAMVCAIECFKTGTTCIADPGPATHADPVAKALVDSGLRATTAAAVSDIDDPRKPNPEVLRSDLDKSLKTARNLFKKYHNAGNGRIRVGTAVRQDIMASEQLLREMKEFADKNKTFFRTHAAISKDQMELVKERTGKGVIEWLESVGILGPNLLLIHMGWITDEAVKILKKHDVKVAHCPSAALHSAYGSCMDGKFPELVKAGVTVSLGPDSAAVNNSVDLFREMYLFAGIYKEIRRDVNIITPEQALEAGTIVGARANNWDDEIGSLEKGKKADLIIVDANKWGWVPMYDFSIVPNLIYCGMGHDVRTTIIDGKIVMEDRVIKTMKEEEWIKKGQQVGDRAVAKSGLNKRIKSPWPVS